MPKKLPETNPFVQKEAGFVIHALWKLDRFGTEEEHGVVGGNQARAYRLEIDDRTQLYTAHVLDLFKQLSSAAKDMFIYIAIKLPYNQDYLELDEVKYCAITGVSRATFYAAKQQLTNRLLIPRVKRNNTYWINPVYMFKGDRMKAFPHAVVTDNEHPFNKLSGV